MLRKRVIPVLLMRGTGLYKTRRFADPKYVGDPINVVRIFNDKEVDELFLFDVEASKAGRGPAFATIERIVGEAFMPVGYGGGIRSVEDARRLLALGIEKVAVNSGALERPSLVRELRDAFGSQCVVGVVDVKRGFFGGCEVYAHAGGRVPERDPVRWAERLVAEGVGELLVQAVHRDGTMEGYDIELLRRFEHLPVPVVGCGGAGSVEHMRQALASCRLSGLGVGARFVYHGPHRAVLVSYLSPAELASLEKVGT